MKIKSLFKCLLVPMLALVAFVAGGCSEDNYDIKPGYGFAQFKLRKTATRAAGDDRLDSMSQAHKMQVVLQNDGRTFTQTVLVEAYDDEAAEYGLTSEKLELKAGAYTLTGYYLFNKKEEQILAGEPDEPQTFIVEDGGLTVQEVGVNALHRGRVRFTLTKDIQARGTRFAQSEKTYLFNSVAYIDVTLENTYTKNRIAYTDLPVKYTEKYTTDEKTGATYTSAVGVIDTAVVADAGTYDIVYYATKAKVKTNVLGYAMVSDDEPTPIGSEITVTDNRTTAADIPVTLREADPNIKDYVALKAIWEKMDGRNWSFHGETYTDGTNWNFNKDIDMWGEQPGVVLNSEGRVTALNIGDFNPQGDVPEELGGLTELTILTLGTHNDLIGGVNPSATVKGSPSASQLKAIRSDYYNRVLKQDPYRNFSDALRLGFQLKGLLPKASRVSGGIRPKDVQPSDYTNGIKSIPSTIGNLTKLEQLYIANGKVETLPAELARLTELRDVEVYNCKKMTKFPMVLASIPNLEALNFAMNPQMSSNEIENGLKAVAKGAAGKTMQILYLGHNNLTELPVEFGKMTKLGKLDCTYNKIKTVHALGTDVNLVQLTMDHNEIESIPANFCGVDDVETFTFSYNKLKSFPNIFDANSIYVMSSIDFSHNQISGFDGEADGTFKGVNAQSIDLSYNNLIKFPAAILKTGSPVSQLTLAGNKIETFTKDDISSGKNRYMLQSLDLSWNRLSDLPDNFTAEIFPYFYGIELSYNRFTQFPWEPLNSAYLTVFSMRYQRDAKGNRCMRQWPEGIYKHTGLRALYLGGNDIRKVPDSETISYLIYNLDISDNPNIYINLSAVCPYIQAGRFNLFYDHTQNIVGCDYLKEN